MKKLLPYEMFLPTTVRCYGFPRDVGFDNVNGEDWKISICIDRGLPFPVFCQLISQYVSDEYGINAILEVFE